MVRSMVLGILMSAVAAGSVYAQEPAAPAAAAQAAKPNQRVFSGDGGLFLFFIKPDKTADFEAVVGRLKEALQKSENPQRKEQATGWKIFKNADAAPGAAGPVIYVGMVDPAVKDADYDMINILSEAFPTEAQALYNQYVGALAQGTNIVNLSVVQKLGQ
jgi:hypothetical protein